MCHLACVCYVRDQGEAERKGLGGEVLAYVW